MMTIHCSVQIPFQAHLFKLIDSVNISFKKRQYYQFDQDMFNFTVHKHIHFD